GVALRRGRAERGGGAGGVEALYRDDLPDRRPRARGRLSGVRPRYRAATQAAPERDSGEVPRLAAPRRAAAGAVPRIRPPPGQPPGALPRSQYPPRDRALGARAAVPEAHRGDDRDLPRSGADTRPDGPLPGGERPGGAAGGLGARREPPPGRSR